MNEQQLYIEYSKKMLENMDMKDVVTAEMSAKGIDKFVSVMVEQFKKRYPEPVKSNMTGERYLKLVCESMEPGFSKGTKVCAACTNWVPDCTCKDSEPEPDRLDELYPHEPKCEHDFDGEQVNKDFLKCYKCNMLIKKKDVIFERVGGIVAPQDSNKESTDLCRVSDCGSNALKESSYCHDHQHVY